MFKSFRVKLFLAFLLISVVISGGGIYLTYRLGIEAQLGALKRTVVGVATTASFMIDPELHKKLNPDELKIDELTNSLNHILYNIAESNADISYVYTIVETNNPDICKFVLSSDEYELKEKSPDIECDVTEIPELRDKIAFLKPVATEKFYTDKWGTWITGYAPLKDKDNKIIAVVAVDLSLEKVLEYQKIIKFWSLIILTMSIMVSLFLSYTFSSRITVPLIKITEHTKVISEGDFKKIEDIEAKDEIKTLADAFNDMIDKLDFLFLELHNAQDHLKDAYLDTILRLAVSAEYKDKVTSEHLKRVSTYASIIARKLSLSPEEIDSIRYGAPMHDIGKIGIPDNILLKEGKLTAEEYKIIKEHTVIGYNILKGSESPYLKSAAVISLTHHENFDGTGYPYGIKGEDIHIYGRILAVADVFDAMTTERPYKKPIPLEETLRMIKDDSGRKFDPKIVDAFFSCLDEIKKHINYVEWRAL